MSTRQHGRRRGMALATMLAALTAAGPTPPAEAAGGRATERIVVLEDGGDGARSSVKARARALAGAAGARPVRTFRHVLQGFTARLDGDQAAALEDRPGVAAVVRPRPVRAVGALPALTPVLGGGDAPPNLRRIGAAPGGAVAPAPAGVDVAVVDTGVDLRHPDLDVRTGIDCVDGGPATDADGHGTHVAGIVGARNDGRGALGVAPGARLWSVRVLAGHGAGDWADILCGLDWVVGTRRNATAADDIDVVNLSLAGEGGPPTDCDGDGWDVLHVAVCATTRAGIVVVAAAGNDGRPLEDYVPARYPEALAVTAMGDGDGRPGGVGDPPPCWWEQPDDVAAVFTNHAATPAGRAHTVAAPGVCIASTARGGGVEERSGTSMAAPHAAGAVALCLAPGGPCAGRSPAAVVRRFVADAAAASAAPGSGFAGDNRRPLRGRRHGDLVRVPFELRRPAPTRPPAVTGAPRPGAVLRADDGGWAGTAPVRLGRRWLRCAGDGTRCAGAGEGATLRVGEEDAGRVFRLRVTATGPGGTAAVTSAPTAVVPEPAAPPAGGGAAVRILDRDLGAALARGLRVRVRRPGGATVRLVAQVDATAARRLGLPARHAGTATARPRGSGDAEVRVRLSGRVRARLARVARASGPRRLALPVRVRAWVSGRPAGTARATLR